MKFPAPSGPHWHGGSTVSGMMRKVYMAAPEHAIPWTWDPEAMRILAWNIANPRDAKRVGDLLVGEATGLVEMEDEDYRDLNEIKDADVLLVQEVSLPVAAAPRESVEISLP